MEKHRFVHKRIEYIHAWDQKRHLNPIIAEVFGKRLLKYYYFTSSKDYPEHIFNHSDITRCSSFRITGLRKNSRKMIGLNLIKSGKVHLINKTTKPKFISEKILKLPEMANIWQDIFFSLTNENPGHGPILEKILKINENALSIETPIWTTSHAAVKNQELKMSPFSCLCDEVFTGHIDLLLFDELDQSLVVADYKPENHFLTSLAQVATYGLVMKRILRYPKVKCVSFSREKAWLYDPEILRTSIPKYLKINGNPALDWQEFIHSV